MKHSLKDRHIDTIVSKFRVTHGIEVLHVRQLGFWQASIRRKNKGRGSARGATKEEAMKNLGKQLDLEGWQYL
jgi:hypothetical protein